MANSEAWILTPIRVIQRREPLTSGPSSSVATISAMLTTNTMNAVRLICGDKNDTPISTIKGRQQEQDVAVEEVKRVEPDAGRHRRTGRQRQNDAAQDQREHRRQLQAIEPSTTSR